MPRLTRRSLLLSPVGIAAANVAANAATATGIAALPGLQRRATRTNRFYGAAIDQGILAFDPAYMTHVPPECGVLVGESSFKWAEVHPQPNGYNYQQADALLRYAQRHAMRVRGHTLLWYQANPPWLEHTLNAGNAERILSSHIHNVAGHFRGKLMHWDVVNEVLWPQDEKPLGLRDSLWYRAMGPRFLDVAFHACAETDPNALRCINDYGMDYTLEDEDRKRGAMLELLSSMLARGVPVQAVGLQAHLDAGIAEVDQTVLAKFVADIASLGLKIVITEMDLRDNRLPADRATRDAAVAAHGRAYLEAVLDHPQVLGVLNWGLSDRRSWLNDEIPRTDRLPQRPLPLDTELRRKPLWSAMAEVFDGLRTQVAGPA